MSVRAGWLRGLEDGLEATSGETVSLLSGGRMAGRLGEPEVGDARRALVVPTEVGVVTLLLAPAASHYARAFAAEPDLKAAIAAVLGEQPATQLEAVVLVMLILAEAAALEGPVAEAAVAADRLRAPVVVVGGGLSAVRGRVIHIAAAAGLAASGLSSGLASSVVAASALSSGVASAASPPRAVATRPFSAPAGGGLATVALLALAEVLALAEERGGCRGLRPRVAASAAAGRRR